MTVLDRSATARASVRDAIHRDNRARVGDPRALSKPMLLMMSEALSLALLLTGYKVASLIVGLAFGYMGYRLFLGLPASAGGEFAASGGTLSVKLRNAAPGTFFSLFGAMVVCFSIWKGVEFKPQHAPPPPLAIYIPTEPPP